MAKARRETVEAEPAPPRMPDAREMVELWIRLSRSDWTSILLVPADPEGSTGAVAKALADIGQRLSFFQVTAITINALEFGSALALADLQQQVDRDRQVPRAPEVLVTPPPDGTVVDPPPKATTESLVVSAPARLIISIPAVVAEPLGLKAAHEADAVIIAIRMGRSQVGDVRRTIELIGRERIAGCILTP